MQWSSIVLPALLAVLIASCSTTEYRDYSKPVVLTGSDAKLYGQTILFPGLALKVIPLNHTNRFAYMGLSVLPIPVAFFQNISARQGVFGIKLVLAPEHERFLLDARKVFLQWDNERRAPLGLRRIDSRSSKDRGLRSQPPIDKILVNEPVCLILDFPTPPLEPNTSFSLAIEGLEQNDKSLAATTVTFEKASGWRYTAHLGFKDLVLGSSSGGDADCGG